MVPWLLKRAGISFFADHGLREGYTVAFHYIIKAHFVVQIIDNTGFEKLKFPIANSIANRKKRKRSKIDGNYNAVGECENISNNSTRKKGSAISVTPYSEGRTHSPPMNKDKPSSAFIISGAANGTQRQPMSKNKSSSLENGNSIYQPVLSADCPIEQFYMINRDAGYRHEEDRITLLDLSNFEMQCRADAYGSNDKRSRPSITLAESNAVANILNKNLVSGKVASGVPAAEVSAFKMFDSKNVTSKRENMAVVENDYHHNHPYVLPIKQGAQVHTENRIKSSTTSSKRIKCENAAGCNKHSSEIVKLPRQETMELGKSPSCEPIHSGEIVKLPRQETMELGKSPSCEPIRSGKYPSAPSASVELNSLNFDELVLKSKELWVVEFFAPWCGHCKKLAPEWKKASINLKGKVKLGHADCEADKSLMSRFNVEGFPTILVFGPDKDRPFKYEGARTASAIESFALEQLETNILPPEVTELTSQDVMEEKCGSAAICFVAFLPDILDSKAEGRNKYLQLLLSVAEKFKTNPYSYVWAAAGKQPELEKQVGVGGYGYPALVALNVKKEAYAPLRSAFERDQITDFIRQAGLGGKGNLALASAPEIVKTEPWDGKDGQILEEDEFSLEELMGEESKDEL